MKKLVEFRAFGLDVVPWSVPNIGNMTTKAGKRVRFTTRPKKSRLELGKASLEDWQRFVAAAAREAMATIPLQTGPIRLHVQFFATTHPGCRHGQLWTVPVEWNEEKEEWVKLGPRGKSEPDLVNLFKGTEDAIESVVYANDVQTRMMSSICLYGPSPGVIVSVYEIEETDFPGQEP